jgi:transcriptional regulator with XRE-family HTH domain
MKILVAQLRKDRGVSQTDLAARAGISRPYLAQIESGKRKLSLNHQQVIASALGVSPSDIVDFEADDGDERLIQDAFASLSSGQRRVWIDLAKSVLKSGTQGS